MPNGINILFGALGAFCGLASLIIAVLGKAKGSGLESGRISQVEYKQDTLNDQIKSINQSMTEFASHTARTNEFMSQQTAYNQRAENVRNDLSTRLARAEGREGRKE